MLHPKFDLQTRALAYYLHDHFHALTDRPNVWGGLSECVSIWKISDRKCPMVDLALSSMALAIFSRTQHHPPAAAEASVRYHRLLRAARARIAQVGTSVSDERDMDACLLSVSLMSRYESSTPSAGCLFPKNFFTTLPCWSHHDGAMAILKVWHDSPSQNGPTKIMKHTRRDLIKCFWIRNLPLPHWVLDGKTFGEHGLELEYDRIFVRILNLCYASASLQQDNDLDFTIAEELNREARDLDRALQDWAAQIPSTGTHRRHILTEPEFGLRKTFYSSIAYSYSNLGYGATWSEYFATRLLINSTRLKLLDSNCADPWIEVTHQMQRLKCIAQMNTMADNLASTIPFCLERFKVDSSALAEHQPSITLNASEQTMPHLANLVVWPLTIASSLGRIDERQRLWFRSELASLGRLIGNSVLECAETEQWGLL